MPGFLRKTVIFLAFVFCVIFAAPGAYAACCDAGYYGTGGKSCTACPAPFNNSDNVGKTCPNTTINSCYLTLPSGYYYNGKSGAVEVCPTGYTCPGGATVYYGETGQIGRTANCNQINRDKNPPAGIGSSVVPILYKKTGSTAWYSDNTCTTQQTTPTNIPTYSGYICTGFYTEESGGTRVIDQNGNLLSWYASQPTYIYAQWINPIVTVSLNNQSATTAGSTAVYERYNTGIYLDAAATSQQMTTSANHITLPTRTGYTFGGYYTGTNGTGTQLINASGYITNSFTTTRFTAGTTIYAKWTPNTYTVTFKSGDITIGTQTFTYGTAQNLTALADLSNVSALPEYLLRTTSGATNLWRFKGWTTNNNSTTTSYANGTSVNNLSSTNGGVVTLYGVWQRTLYYRRFSSATATNWTTAANTQYYKGNTSVSNLSLPALVAHTTYGWNPVGWVTNASSTTPDIAQTTAVTLTPAANTTIPTYYYALYNRTITLSYDANGGSGTVNNQTAVQHLSSGVNGQHTISFTLANASGLTAPTGYSFSKWAPGSVNGTPQYDVGASFDFPNETLSSDSTYTMYAIWTPNTITLDWNENGGGAINNGSCTYDGDLTLPSAPTRPGYTFTGWKLANNTTQSAGATITGGCTSTYTGVTSGTSTAIQAQWSAQSSTVTLNSNGGTAGSVTSVTATYDAAMPTISGNGALPTRPGYTFDGYGDDATTGGIKYYNADGTSAHTWDKTGNQVLYAIWEANCNEITINISANGGTLNGDAESVTLYKYTDGDYWSTHNLCRPRDIITTLTDFGLGGLPTKTNATYSGTYENQGTPTGAQVIAADGTLNNSWNTTQNTTIYAHYNCNTGYSANNDGTACVANTYTISYAGMDGATHGSSHPTTGTYDTEFTVNNPTKPGYTFAGWDISGMDSVTHYYGASSATSTSTATSLGHATITPSIIKFKNLRATSGTVTFTAAWTPNVIASASDKQLTYNGSAQSCANVTVTTPGSGYTIKYSNVANGTFTTTVPTMTNVSESPKTIYYQVSAPNHITATGSYSCSMVNAADVVTIMDGSTNVTNSGSATTFPNNKVLTASCASGATPTLSNTGTASVATTTISNGTITMVPVAAGATTSTITVKCAAASNYNPATATYTLTVNKGTITHTPATLPGNSKVYDTQPLSCTGGITGRTPSNATMQYAEKTGSSCSGVSYSSTVPSRTNVGTTTVCYKLSAANYNDKLGEYSCTVTQASGSTTIKDGNTDVTNGSGSVVYPSTKSLTAICAGGATISSVTSGTTSVATVSNSGNNITITPVAAGATTSTITVNCPATTNYAASSATYTITVNKGTCTVSLSAASGSTAYPATKQITASSNSGGTLSVASSAESVATAAISNGTVTMTPVAQGNATITVTSAATSNYNSCSASYALTVNRGTCTMTLTPTSGTVTYPGNTTTFNIDKGASNGAVSTSLSNNTSSATVALSSNSTVGTVTYGTSGGVTVTVTAAQTNQYNSCSATYTGTAADKIITLKKNGGTGTCGGATGVNDGTLACTLGGTCTAPSWNSSTCNITNGTKIFDGWATSANGAVAYAPGANLNNAPTTLYAHWSNVTCSVTNGTGTATTPSNNAPRCNVTCNDGYSTSGTYTGTGTTVTYACTGNDITLDWDENGGGAIANGSCTYGGDLTLPAAPSRTGYTFTKWKLADGTLKDASSTVTNGCIYTYTNKYSGTSTAIQAQWTANTNTPYTVYHYIQGVPGSTYTQYGNTETLYGTTGATVTLATLKKTITGYTYLEGFAAGPTGNVKPSSGAVLETTILANGSRVITLYYNRDTREITLDNANATTNGTSTIYTRYQDGVWLNSARTSPLTTTSGAITKPQRTGYTFNGYYSQASGGTQYISNIGRITQEGIDVGEAMTASSPAATWHAQWSPNTYSISYAGMGGATHGDSHPTSATYDVEFTVSNPTKTGYDFAGWNITGMDSTTHYYGATTADTSTTATSLNNIMVTKFKNLRTTFATVTFTAVWNPKTTAITLDKNAADAVAGTTSVTGTYSEAMPSITIPTRLGYSFRGYWDTNAASGGNQYYKSDGTSYRTWNKTEATATLYGRWNLDFYTISYALNGGTNSANNPSNWTITDSSMTLTRPTRANSTFTGWTVTTAPTAWGTGSSSSGALDFVVGQGTYGDIAFEATWACNTGYSANNDGTACVAQTSAVTFNKNASDAVAGTPQSVTATYGSAMPTPVTSPTRPGYTFMGYYDTPNATGGTQYYGGYEGNGSGNIQSAHVWDKVGDQTLYARWAAKCNKITFDGTTNGGTSLTGKFLYKLTDDPAWYTSSKCSGTTVTTLRGASITPPTKSYAMFTGFFENAGIPTGTKVVDDEMTMGALSTTWTVNGDTTLYAHYDCDEHWQGNGVDISGACDSGTQYNIYYVMNGGINYAGAPTSYTYGTGATINGTPTREHSGFGGWCTDSGLNTCTGTQTISTTDYGDKTFYAKWKCLEGYSANNDGSACVANTITLNWNENGGSAVANGSCTYDGDLILPAAPSKTGYTFVEWVLYDGTAKSAGTTVDNGCVYEKTGVYEGTSTSITARWSPNTYTIAYAGMTGATHGDNHPTSATYDEDVKVSAPSKPGYTFAGWNISGMDTTTHYHGTTSANTAFNTTTLNGTMSTKFRNLRASSGTVTFTAIWTANTNTAYKVCRYTKNLGASAYTLNGGACENKTGTTGATITLFTEATNITGFTYDEGFAGTAATGINKPESGAVTTTTILADGTRVISLYYNRNSYTVTLTSGNGISAVTGGGTYEYGANVSINATVKNGYTWSKWQQTTGGAQVSTTKNYTFTMPASDLSYTAVATLNTYTITYDLDGGTHGTTHPTTYNVTSADIILSNPTKTGYTFGGWTVTVAPNGWGTGSSNSGSTNFKIATGTYGNIAFKAIWTTNAYVINYDMRGGINYTNAPTSYTYGVGATINGTPSRANSTFTGWTGDNGDTPQTTITISTTATGDKNYIANWSCLDGYHANNDGTACVGNTITLNYANGGHGTAPAAGSCTYGSTFDLPLLTAAGYTFDEWHVNNNAFDNGQTGVACNYANLGVYSGSVTITATWNTDVYTVTLSDGTGAAQNGAPSPIYLKYNDGWYSNQSATTTISALTTTPIKVGYLFDGYYTGENGTGTQIINNAGTIVANNTAITADTTVYAKYTAQTGFTVTTVDDMAAGTTFKFAISAAGRFYVDWGDGTVQPLNRTSTTTELVSHQYTTGGSKNITIYGRATGYSVNAVAAIRFGGSTTESEVTKDLVGGISGSLTSVFPTVTGVGSPIFEHAFGNCTRLSGNIPTNLFAGLSGEPRASQFAYLFEGDNGLTGQIPSGFFGDISGTVKKSTFERTFYGCSGLQGGTIYAIPENLFDNIRGSAQSAFAQTFGACSGLVGQIPANLFEHLTGTPQSRMFLGTFRDCVGLTGTVPEDLFGGITGAAESSAFNYTFGNCSGLTGYVPRGLFAGMTATSSARAGTFSGSGLVTECPCGMKQYITGFEGADGKISTKVSCQFGAKTGEYWHNGHCVTECESGITRLRTSNGVDVPLLRAKVGIKNVAFKHNNKVCYSPVETGNLSGHVNLKQGATTYHISEPDGIEPDGFRNLPDGVLPAPGYTVE